MNSCRTAWPEDLLQIFMFARRARKKPVKTGKEKADGSWVRSWQFSKLDFMRESSLQAMGAVESFFLEMM